MTDVPTPARSTWALANLADTASPDRPDGTGDPVADANPSPGAVFLRGVEDGAREALTDWAADQDPDELAGMDPHGWVEGIDHAGGLHEAADSAVPIYTHDLWATFVDVGAYEGDPSELGDPDGRTMTELAGWCLYGLAWRLARALVAEWAGEWIADYDPDEDGDR